MSSPKAPVLEKDEVELVLSKVVHGCGTYRIEYHPGDMPPSYCPACGVLCEGDMEGADNGV